MNYDEHVVSNEGEDGKIYSYHVPTLWNMVADHEILEIDIVDVIRCFNNFINQFNEDDWDRVIKADLTYPIIINDIYGILDGCHRTVKAMMLGQTTIMAKRLNDLPDPIKIWDSWQDYRNV